MYNFYQVSHGVPIKAWSRGVEFDDNTLEQLRKTARLPFAFHHVAAMADAHVGIGCTVGSVVATKGAIVPACVGVDIGCGMVAAKTTLTASDLPDNLLSLRMHLESIIPVGRTDNGGLNDKGSWPAIPPTIWEHWLTLSDDYERIIQKYPKAYTDNSARHLGTLGTGNHFIEICLDESDAVWVMLHSGSRGVGNRIGSLFIELAKKEMERYYIDKYLPDKDLSYLVEHTEVFNDYLMAVDWAQDFAKVNRKIMLDLVLSVLRERIKKPWDVTQTVINCHHNYVQKEHHFGSNVLVTRKGAIRAREGDLGIIPGSMGTGSFVVRGLGSSDSFHSCSHGAGRRMSRNVAKKTVTLEQHKEAVKGVECRVDADVLDETPAAYKSISAVMAAQSDLIEIVHSLRQVLNIKG